MPGKVPRVDLNPLHFIYKITSLIDGKIYIGQTNNLARRRANHFGLRCSNKNLKAAMQETLKLTYTFEQIDAAPKDQIDDLERKYILQFDCLYPKGYNVELGGRKGPKRKRKSS